MKFPSVFGMANAIAPTPAGSTDTSSMATATQTVTETVTETIQNVMGTAISGSFPRGRQLHRRLPSLPARVLTAIAPGYSRAFGRWGQENPLLARLVLASSGILAGTNLYRLSRAIYVRSRKYNRERKRLRRARQAREAQKGMIGGQRVNRGMGGKFFTLVSETWWLTIPIDVEDGAMANSHGLNASSSPAPLSKERNYPGSGNNLPASGLLPTSQASVSSPSTYKGDFPSRTHEILALTKQVAELGKRFKGQEISAKDYTQQSEPLRKQIALLKDQDKQAKEALKSADQKTLGTSPKIPGSVVPTTKRKLSLDANATEGEKERTKIPRSESPEYAIELDLTKKPVLQPSNNSTSDQTTTSPVRPSLPPQDSSNSAVPANPSDNPPHLPPPHGPRRAVNILPSKINGESTSSVVATTDSNQTTTPSEPLESKDRNPKTPTSPSKTRHAETHSPKSEHADTPTAGRRSERSTRYTSTMNVNTLSRRSASPEKAASEPSERPVPVSSPTKEGKEGDRKRGKSSLGVAKQDGIKEEEKEEEEEE